MTLNKFLKKLQRNPTSTQFIAEIDGMRFFAIFTVLIFHLNTAFSKEIKLEYTNDLPTASFFNIGWWIIRLDVGVKVFFAISGFILAIPFLKQYLNLGKKVVLKDYFIKRLTRLEPPFILSLIAFFFVHLLILHADFYDLLKSFFAGLFYAHFFIFGYPNPINPVTWSLETEAQFYIIIPFFLYCIFYFKNKWTRLLLFILIFLMSIFSKNWIMKSDLFNIKASLAVFLINFMVGIVVAYLYLTSFYFFKIKNHLWDFIGLFAVFCMFYFYKPQLEKLNILFLNLTVFLFFISVFKGKITNWFYTRPIIYTIGGMCYSIYLLHYAFFHLSIKVTSKICFFSDYNFNLIVQILITIPLVLAISALFFVFIEKPFMNKEWYKEINFEKYFTIFQIKKANNK
jgi:peptidoglycan/LPS O-acetylase OafA/YrhL